jgi:iron complex outermembrane receptor protein
MVDSYGMLNVYVGVRGNEGAWDVAVYGKNVTETERVLRSTNPLTVSYRQGPTAAMGVASYRSVSVTDPREFGLNLRYAFGSR